MRAGLGQGLKETAILNSSNFGLTLLYITGFLMLWIFSIYLKSNRREANHKILMSHEGASLSTIIGIKLRCRYQHVHYNSQV